MSFFRSSRGSTIAAIVTLALGIGAATTVWSFVSALVLDPLPFEQPGELVSVMEALPARGVERNELSPANYLDLAREARRVEMGAYQWWSANLTGGDRPERVQGFRVSANFFRLLGVRPLLGRTFAGEEAAEGRDGVVILSHALWRDRFGADSTVPGRAILVNGAPHVVIGVMPQAAAFPSGAQLWVPLAFTPDEAARRGSHYLLGLGRLRDGATLEEARGELARVAARLEREHPETNRDRTVAVTSLLGDATRHVRPGLAMMLGAVTLVLLIGCANVANLLLARGVGRRKELAIRAALGAGRLRLVRQLLGESLVLGLAAGALGVVLSVWMVDLLRARVPATIRGFIAGWDTIAIDAPVLGFALLAALASAALVGIIPALRVSAADPAGALRAGGRQSGAAPHARARNALVTGEVALAALLLVAVGLLVQSVRALERVPIGFEPDGVAAVQMILPSDPYADSGRAAAFYDALFARIGALPGVEQVGGTTHIPFCGCNSTNTFAVEGAEPFPVGQEPDVGLRRVTPGYFETLQVPLVAGRRLTSADDAGAAPVILVNREFARRWLGPDPVGRRVVVGSTAREVVGIVGDMRHLGPAEPAPPEMYLPFHQAGGRELVVLARTAGDPTALLDAMRAQVAALDPNQPVFNVATLRQTVDGVMSQHSLLVEMLSGFALLALVLSGIGVYGVIAFTVAQRHHELGVRRALGADGGRVVAMVVRQALAPVAIGLAIGLAAAAVLMRGIGSLLVGVRHTDPVTYVTVTLALLAVGLLAALVPARRASRIDPMMALRAE